MFCRHVFGNISGVFRVIWGNSRDFAENPEIRGSTTARIIRSPDNNSIVNKNISNNDKYSVTI